LKITSYDTGKKKGGVSNTKEKERARKGKEPLFFKRGKRKGESQGRGREKKKKRRKISTEKKENCLLSTFC